MISYIADSKNIIYQRTKKYSILRYHKYNIFRFNGQYGSLPWKN